MSPAEHASKPALIGLGYALLTTAVVAILSAYLFYPALFLDESLVHGDNLHHGYALLKFHSDVIHQGLSPLWTNRVYGGHALFAEGQAGLSNPLNYLVAWLLPPEFGHNLIHWLAMIAMGVGCYGLSRTLLIGPFSSMFAALAGAFSSLAIHTNTNMMAVEAMAWVPLTLWAFESWLRQPTINRALVFGLSTAMLVFSGYPQFLHGTVIYMLVSSSTLFLGAPLRKAAPQVLHRYWAGGVIAVLVCVTLSSIQWLPLLELASLSHRQGGVEMSMGGTAEFQLRGLLYSSDNVSASGIDKTPYFPNTGSLIVCFLATLSLVLPTSARIKGHIIATILLLNLGLGPASPVYTFVKSYHLLPGIDNFRIMFPYFNMSLVGIAVLAASSIDRLSHDTKQRLSLRSRRSLARWALILLFWCFSLYQLHTSAAPTLNYLILGLNLICLAILAKFDKLPVYAVVSCVLLLAEILLLKVTPFGTVENRVLTAATPVVRYINSLDDADQFKHYQLGPVALSFSSPYSSNLEGRALHELRNIVASTNLFWGIPSFSGALALKSDHKPMANAAVVREIEGSGDHKPGYRLMDVLSIRWVSKRLPDPSQHLRPVKDADGKFIVWENDYAKPMVQTYQRTQLVDNPEQALQALTQDSSGLLYLEASAEQVPRGQLITAPTAIVLQTQRYTATDYEFISSADAGYWLFFSDTFHPGWKATIDGSPTTVFPAQVLGKAFYVPQGEHQVRLYFQSDTFRLGALLTGTTILCLIVYMMYRLRKTWPGRT